ncbi:hypothetical protein BJX63DRAFT_404356 [Aspergillus granulosus]|uniref:Uncharacterized protein n=1 Tax=Aspergillus granulosus TaxID=176169 RepID=A0ABR4H2P7_9EURO
MMIYQIRVLIPRTVNSSEVSESSISPAQTCGINPPIPSFGISPNLGYPISHNSRSLFWQDTALHMLLRSQGFLSMERLCMNAISLTGSSYERYRDGEKIPALCSIPLKERMIGRKARNGGNCTYAYKKRRGDYFVALQRGDTPKYEEEANKACVYACFPPGETGNISDVLLYRGPLRHMGKKSFAAEEEAATRGSLGFQLRVRVSLDRPVERVNTHRTTRKL